jgi:hypothetical protein
MAKKYMELSKVLLRIYKRTNDIKYYDHAKQFQQTAREISK